MNREDIINMAQEAGLQRNGYWEFDLVRLERFAALVAAHERKVCAKVCKDADAEIADAEILAERILARSNT
jgi:hypothetical protein